MTNDRLATDDPVWGAPEPGPRRRGVCEAAAAVGVAAVIAGLGGAAIYAATDSAPHPAGPPGGPGGPPGIGIHGPGPDSVGATSLHGEFVVPDGVGGYTTVLSQTGTVTAVSPTAVTVRSDDGYSQTYVMPQPTGPSPAIDDQVSVRATRSGQTATLTSISEPDGPGPRN